MMLRRDWYTTLQLTVGFVLVPNFDKYATKLDLFTLFKYNKAVDKELFYVLLGGLQILRKVWTDKELQCLLCNYLATPNYQAFGLTDSLGETEVLGPMSSSPPGSCQRLRALAVLNITGRQQIGTRRGRGGS